MIPALDRLVELTAGNAEIKAAVDAVRPTALLVAHTWWKGTTQTVVGQSAAGYPVLTQLVRQNQDCP